jgi:hypothetical protein
MLPGFRRVSTSLPPGQIVGERLDAERGMALRAVDPLAVAAFAARGLHSRVGPVAVKEGQGVWGISGQVVPAMTCIAPLSLDVTEVARLGVDSALMGVSELPAGALVTERCQSFLQVAIPTEGDLRATRFLRALRGFDSGMASGALQISVLPMRKDIACEHRVTAERVVVARVALAAG